jgi:putative hydrolase of the HAD superfamily
LRDVLPAVGLAVGDDEELDRLFADYLAQYRDCWVAFDDVPAAVARLHGAGIRMAVLTNGLDAQQRAKVEALGLSGVVDPVVTAEELGVAKPDPAAYRAVCLRLGMAPESVLHVGDRHDLDVVAARAAGLQAVHLDRRGLGPVDEPSRISSLDELRIRGVPTTPGRPGPA